MQDYLHQKIKSYGEGNEKDLQLRAVNEFKNETVKSLIDLHSKIKTGAEKEAWDNKFVTKTEDSGLSGKDVNQNYLPEKIKTETVNPSNPIHVKDIPLSDITLDDNVRKKVEEHLDKGVASKMNDAPIVLKYSNDGTLEVMDGAHRFIQAERDGKKSIDAQLINVEQDHEKFIPSEPTVKSEPNQKDKVGSGVVGDVKLKGFHSEFNAPSKFTQKSEGAYIALDEPFQNTGITGEKIADATKTSNVDVSINPEKVFDPEGLLDGTKTSKEQKAKVEDAIFEAVKKNNVKGGSKEMAKLRTEVLKSFGYDGEVGAVYPEEAKSPRELIVFDKSKVTKSDQSLPTQEVKDNTGENLGAPPVDNGGVKTPIKPEVVENNEDDPEMTKMANAFNDAKMQGKFGTDAMDKVLSQLQDTNTREIYQKVKTRIEKGTLDLKAVRDRLLTTRQATEEDQAALLYDLAQLKGKEAELNKAIIEEKDPDKQKDLQKQLMDVQNDMADNWLANRNIGRSASTIFRLRQLYATKDMELADMEQQYKASKGLENLTDDQKKEVKAAYTKIRELDAKRKVIKEELDKALQKNDELIKENESLKKLADITKERTKRERSKKTSEKIESSKERIAAAKERLRKLGGNLNSGVDPRVGIELTRIAAEKFYQGIVKFGEVVENVWDEIKDVLPNLSIEDVRNHLLGSSKDASKKYYESTDGVTLSNKDLQSKIDAYKEVQKDYALSVFKWQKDRRMDLMAKRPLKERIIDSILRWQRFAILSYPSTMVKLIAVVGQQLAFKPIKWGIQKLAYEVTKRIAPSVAEKQSLWGNPTARALGKYYSAFIRNFSLANLKEQFGGVDTKEIMYGNKTNYDEWAAAKGFLEIPGRSHGYIKSFIKNPEFQYAHEQYTSHYIDKMMDLQKKMEDAAPEEKETLQHEYDKVDITNEEVMDKVNHLALLHGRWAILMNDNGLVKKFNNMADKNSVTGAILRSEVPIAKIPTNYIGRAFATKYGLIRAITGKGKWESKDEHFPGIVEMIIKGTKNLTEEQADLLGRTITLGTMGAGLFALGYMNRKKIKQNPDGSYDIFGVHISKNLVHSPEMEAVFSGAETGSRYDKESGSWLKDLLASDIDVVKKSPFISMLKYGALPNSIMALLSFADNKASLNSTENKLTDILSKKIADMTIPGFIKQPAQWADTKQEGVHPMGEYINRKPKSENFGERLWQGIETGLPFLRKNVPESGYYNGGTGGGGGFSEGDLKLPTIKAYINKGVAPNSVNPNKVKIDDAVVGKKRSLSEYSPEEIKDYSDKRDGFLKKILVEEKKVYVDKYGNTSVDNEIGTLKLINELTPEQLKIRMSKAEEIATKEANNYFEEKIKKSSKKLQLQ